MATRTLEIVAKVRDQASQSLKRMEQRLYKVGAAAKKASAGFAILNKQLNITDKALGRSTKNWNKMGQTTTKSSRNLEKSNKVIKNTGKAVQNTNADFTKFNRTMFSTTAFVGLFTLAFRSMTQAMSEGAGLDRLSNQVERVFGDKGTFLKSVRDTTDSSIDMTEAMRAGISLASLGIVKDSKQAADLIARAGVAAKLAGKDSAEGIKQFSEFMKDGSVQHLEFLNLIHRTNPALKIQLAALKKYGDIAGGVLSNSHKLAIGQKVLFLATKDSMRGNRDLYDSMRDIGQGMHFASKAAVNFITKGLVPIFDKVTALLWKFRESTREHQKNSKSLVFLGKTAMVATVALSGLTATLGTMRLMAIALSSLGIGVPVLTGAIGALALAFVSTTHGTEGFMEKLKLFGGVFQGTWQLVSSFLSSPENFAKGIGLMDKSLHDMLKKAGLLGLVKGLARAAALAYQFGAGMKEGVIKTLKDVDKAIGGPLKKLLELLNLGPERWSRSWLKEMKNIGKNAGILLTSVLGLGAAFKLLGFGRSTLSKIPIIGKMFGNRPKGTITDPMYVKDLGLPGVGGAAGKAGKAGKVTSLIKPILKVVLGGYVAWQIGQAIGNTINEHLPDFLDEILTRLVSTLPENIHQRTSRVIRESKHTPEVTRMMKESNITPIPTKLAAAVEVYEKHFYGKIGKVFDNLTDSEEYFKQALVKHEALGGDFEKIAQQAAFSRQTGQPFGLVPFFGEEKPKTELDQTLAKKSSEMDPRAFSDFTPAQLGLKYKKDKVAVTMPKPPEESWLRKKMLTESVESLETHGQKQLAATMEKAFTAANEDEKITVGEFRQVYRIIIDELRKNTEETKTKTVDNVSSRKGIC